MWIIVDYNPSSIKISSSLMYVLFLLLFIEIDTLCMLRLDGHTSRLAIGIASSRFKFIPSRETGYRVKNIHCVRNRFRWWGWGRVDLHERNGKKTKDELIDI
jgi:hypothetical protein